MLIHYDLHYTYQAQLSELDYLIFILILFMIIADSLHEEEKMMKKTMKLFIKGQATLAEFSQSSSH